MCLQRFFIYWICIIALLCVGCDREKKSYDREEALRRVLTVQHLQNFNPGDPAVVPQMEVIIDSMRRSGKDACYFGAVNVLIDRLFSDGRYSEADSLAVRMQREAFVEEDSLAIAMAKRVRAQILYKLSQTDSALDEALSALPYTTDPLRSGPHFGTATSINEWIHIIAQANADTSARVQAGNRYAELVKCCIDSNSWNDPTGHYPVTALAFEADNALNYGNIQEAETLLDSASRLMKSGLPANAYEHFYDTRSRVRTAKGDYAGALADVDTLLHTHTSFPWFYLLDLQLKANIENVAGLHEESARTYSKYIAYHDSLSTKLVNSRLHDLTVLYRSELNQKELHTRRIQLLGLGSVALLLLILLVVTLRHAVAEKKRNRLLVERLHEYDRKEQSQLQSIAEDNQDAEDMSDIERLDKHMILDRPYTDPALSRKELADFLGTTQETLAQMIRNERNCSVHFYINSFRTEEARRILDSEPDATIAGIAVKLGFGTVRTLQRAFKESYGISPSQYRAASNEIRNIDKSETATPL